MTAGTSKSPGDHGGQLAILARRGAASVVGGGFSAIFGVVLVMLVTNGFSPALAGTLFAATSALLILESVALLGTDTGLVKCLPAQLASGRRADLRRTMVIAALPVTVFSLGVGAGVFAAAPALSPHLVGADAAPQMTTMLRLLAVALPVAALYDLLVAATRGAGSMRPTVFVDNVARLGIQAASVGVVHLMGGGALALAFAWAWPYASGLAGAALWLHRLLPARRIPQRPSPWGTLVREFWSFTAPRAIARITQTALKRSDIVLVAALASPAQAALYTAATRFIVLGQLFVQSVQQALSPHLSRLFEKREDTAAASLYRAATLWSMIAAWPLYLVLAGFGPTLMFVFGDGYTVASDVVLILSLTMLLAVACGPVDSVLLMAGRSWLSLRNSVVALAVNVGLNLVLIPTQGIRGAALSWAAAIVVRNLLPLLIVGRQLKMWPLTRTNLRVGAAAVGCFGSAGVVAAGTGHGVAVDALLVSGATVIYAALIWRDRRALDLAAFRFRRNRGAGTTRPVTHVGGRHRMLSR